VQWVDSLERFVDRKPPDSVRDAIVNFLYTARSVGPCVPKAYRLSGPLERWVCGLHLPGGWRIAYSADEAARRLIVLFIDVYDGDDVWDELHALLGVVNPEENHPQPPCCEAGVLERLPDRYLQRLESDLFDHLKEKHGSF